MNTPGEPAAASSGIPAKAKSPALFNRISRRYDLLNHLLSCGLDLFWRRRLALLVSEARHDVVLDVACGTADQLLAIYEHNDDIHRGLGVDMAEKMLRIGARKIAAHAFNDRLDLSLGDGQNLPVASGVIDFATIAFGIRNLPDAAEGLREFLRVLKPGGQLAVLEFSLPTNRFVLAVYLWYFRRVLPWVGGLISGDGRAYRYLNRTVEEFPCGERFCALLTGAGFSRIRRISLTFGIATIYLGEKKADTGAGETFS